MRGFEPAGKWVNSNNGTAYAGTNAVETQTYREDELVQPEWSHVNSAA